MVKKIALIVALSGFCTISAQEKSNNTAVPDSTATQLVLPQSSVKLFIDKIEVEGTLEKPQAVFVLPGKTPEIDDILIERSFLQEIFRPVEKSTTFETTYRPQGTRLRKDVLEW
jgi:hypothetical protein